MDFITIKITKESEGSNAVGVDIDLHNVASDTDLVPILSKICNEVLLKNDVGLHLEFVADSPEKKPKP